MAFITFLWSSLLSLQAFANVPPLACEDLYAASCLGSDRKNKYIEMFKKNEEKAKILIDEARDQTAKSLGFANLDELLKNRLKQAEIKHSEALTEADVKAVKRAEVPPSPNFFSDVSACESQNRSLIDKRNLAVNGTINDLLRIRNEFEAQNASLKNQTVSWFAKDLNDYFSNHLSRHCRDFLESPQRFPADLNPDASSVCSRLHELRHEYAQLYRQRLSSKDNGRAEKFVQDTFIVRLVESNQRPKVNGPKDDILFRLDQLQNDVRTRCLQLKGVLSHQLRQKMTEALLEVNRSKPTIEYLLEKFYPETQKKMIREVVNSSAEHAKEIIFQIVTDLQQTQKIQSHYREMDFVWMEKPDEEAYMKGPSGGPILDFSKMPRSYSHGDIIYNPLIAAISDPHLNFFTDSDGRFSFSVSYGDLKTKSLLKFNPIYFLMFKDHPSMVQMASAHEMGHPLDPRWSQFFGLVPKGQYQEALVCFRRPQSIGMIDNQERETISDSIAAEIEARRLLSLSQEKRWEALSQSMAIWCLADARHQHHSIMNCQGDHVEASLRISGIFGANPNLRKALGCEGPSTKYDTCGIKGISLQSAASQSGPAAPAASEPKGSGAN